MKVLIVGVSSLWNPTNKAIASHRARGKPININTFGGTVFGTGTDRPFSVEFQSKIAILFCLSLGQLSRKGHQKNVYVLCVYFFSPPSKPFCQTRKRSTNPDFGVWIFSVGVEFFHVKGWGPKSSVCPSKPGKPNFFCGISRDFAWISRRCPKSLRNKKSVFNLWPLF